MTQDERDELSKLLRDIETDASHLCDNYRAGLEDAQFVRDIAAATWRVVQANPFYDDTPQEGTLDQQIQDWRNIGASVRRTADWVVATPKIDVTATSSGLLSSEFLTAGETGPRFGGTVSCYSVGNDPRDSLRLLLEARQSPDRIAAQMRRLHLDVARSGLRAPLDHFQAACAALIRSSGSKPDPVAVLVGMRETIDETLQSLLQRGRTQRRCNGDQDKVCAILEQSAREDVDEWTKQKLQEEIAKLRPLLHEAKDKSLSSDAVRDRAAKATAFLLALMLCVDETKLR